MKKSGWQRGTNSRNIVLSLILVCVVLIVHEIFGEHGLLALRHQRQEYESLQREIRQLQEENQKLEQQIKALKSDPKAVEKQAREQLRLARPGEIIYTLPEKDPKTQPPAAGENQPK
jgi:cell division protein FtsB